MALVMTAAPAAEPIDLAEAKAHLRIDGSDEDSLLTAAGAKATLAARDADSPLSRSIEVIDVSEGDSLAFAVGTEEPVGHFLEFGTTRMRAFPWLRPSLHARSSSINHTLRKLVAMALKPRGKA